ncbi:WecB/TagA/CpsF family glycosyltransferase [Oscillatoria sp. CS-180]|nr:WecB/TagA/CpsF family glycosyltransferase [Oscillatoria sp. CS-180]
MTQAEAIRLLLDRCLKRQSGRIYFVNAHTVVTSQRQPEFKRALTCADLLLPDGSGVLWGSRLLGRPIRFNLNGTDLIPALFGMEEAKELSVYLLGAKPGVAGEVARNLKQAYPNLRIVGLQHGYYEPNEKEAVLEKIRNAKPHILLVAMGVPMQELWIDENAKDLPGITCVGVGGLFDFLAKRVPRAPYAIRYVGLEWLWRLLVEPRRLWYRYTVGNFIFMGLIARRFWSMIRKEPFARQS